MKGYLTGTAIVGSVALITLLWRNRSRTQMKGKSLVSINDLSTEEIFTILKLARKYKRDCQHQQNKNKFCLTNLVSGWISGHFSRPLVVGLLFMEPSTRTRCSFEAAAKRLGCSTVSLCDPSTSSASKGESIDDTAQMLQGYCDALVVRHPQKGVVSRLHKLLPQSFPIFNAGDGVGEHPTQALLDLFAIEEEFPGRLTDWKKEPFIVTLMGDLVFGRTAHSLSKLLLRFNVRLQFLSPEGIGMPSEVLIELDQISANASTEKVPRYGTVSSLIEALKSSDVIYATRLQLERLKDETGVSRELGVIWDGSWWTTEVGQKPWDSFNQKNQ